MYGYPVTQAMEIPVDDYRSRFGPEPAALKELPDIVDAGISGVQLSNTLPKAMPKTANIDSGTDARAIAAAEFNRDLAYVTDISKAQAARSRAIARLKGQRSDIIAKNLGKR